MGDKWVVTPRGELDLGTLAPLQQALEEAVRSHPVIVIDLSQVTFGDSSFLTTLLHTHQHTELRLATPSSAVQRLLNVTGADQILHLFPTLSDATT